MKGFTRDNKFVPMTDYKKVTRKSRDPKAKTQGVRLKRQLIKLNVKDPLDETKTDRRKEAMLMKLADENSVITEPEVNWMKKFLNNTFGAPKTTDENFKNDLINAISEQDGYKISPELNQKGIDFLRKNKRKLSQRENLIIDNFDFFTFEGFDDGEGGFRNNLQPIWRVHSTPTNGQSDDFEYQWIGGQFFLR